MVGRCNGRLASTTVVCRAVEAIGHRDDRAGAGKVVQDECILSSELGGMALGLADVLADVWPGWGRFL